MKQRFIIITVLLLVAVGVGAYFLGRMGQKILVENPKGNNTSTSGVNSQNIASNTPTYAPPVAEDPIASWTKESNEKYGYEFRHPNDWYRDPEEAAAILLPGSYLSSKGTIRSATMTEQVTLAKCRLSNEMAPLGEPSIVTKNGINFTRQEYSDAGAGNFYHTISYAVYKAGLCYNFSFLIHSVSTGATFQNPDDIARADTENKRVEADLTDLFGVVIGTITFTR